MKKFSPPSSNLVWDQLIKVDSILNHTVPLKCKLPPSLEMRLVSLECTVSTNALPSVECTKGIIKIIFCAHLQCIHVGTAFILL